MYNETQPTETSVEQYPFGESGFSESNLPSQEQVVEEGVHGKTKRSHRKAKKAKAARPKKAKAVKSTDPRWSPEARAKRAASIARVNAAKRAGKTKPLAKKLTKIKKRPKTSTAALTRLAAANAVLAANTSLIPVDDLPPMARGRPRKTATAALRKPYARRVETDTRAVALSLIRLALDLLER